MSPAAHDIPVVIVPVVSRRAFGLLEKPQAFALEDVVAEDRVMDRADHIHGPDIRGARPARVVIDQHDAVRVPIPLEGLGGVVRERVTQHPGGTHRNGSQRHPGEDRIHGVVTETLVDAGAFRLERIVADVVDMVVVDIGIEDQLGIVQVAGRAGVDAVENVVQ